MKFMYEDNDTEISIEVPGDTGLDHVLEFVLIPILIGSGYSINTIKDSIVSYVLDINDDITVKPEEDTKDA